MFSEGEFFFMLSKYFEGGIEGMKIKKGNFKIYKNLLVVLMVALSVMFIPARRAEAAGAQIPFSFFLEHPYSITDVRANFEWISLDDGDLFMNQYRIDINIYQNLFGLYAKFPFAGVLSFGPDDDDSYDFGNIGLGGKFVLLNMDNAVLTAGLELIVPTASDDLGAFAAQRYFRDFAYFVDEAWTIKPYLVFGASGGGWFAFQANVDFDILFNAEDIDPFFETGGDDNELIVKYGGTVSVTPPLNLPFSAAIVVELLAASSTSFDNNITGVYLTPGIRLGGQIVSVGAGVEIPFGSDEVSDFADFGLVFDLIIRFGS